MYFNLILLLFTFHFSDAYHCEKRISSTGYDITPWSKDKILLESKKVYSDDDIRNEIIQNGATEKSYTGKFFNGERYNHKEEGVYVSGILYCISNIQEITYII